MSAYISEVKYNSEDNNFVEIAVPKGTNVSGYQIVIYDSSGTVSEGDDDEGSNPMGLGTLDSTNVGKDVYAVNLGEDMLSGSGGVALVDDSGTVIQFISFNGNTVTATEGAAAGQTSTSIGSARGSTTLQSTDGGGTYALASASKGTIPCYAFGTLIKTPRGLRAVEDLEIGDMVQTLDVGPRRIKWLNRAEQPLEQISDDACPILIRADAFGQGRPARDLIVSPQHRILVGGEGQLDGRFDGTFFAPAKALTCLPGIRMMKGKRRIEWVHFAFDTHEIVCANGCLTESLLLGPLVMAGLTQSQRKELKRIFGSVPPTLALNGPPARPCLRVGEVRDVLESFKHRMRSKKAA